MEWDIVNESCPCSSILMLSECIGAKKNSTGCYSYGFSTTGTRVALGICRMPQICMVWVALQGIKKPYVKA